jgi:hypothetical protein
MLPPPSDDELVEHIVDHLCEEQAAAVGELSDAEIERRVRLALPRARSHGFSTPEPATAYVTLMFLVSPCFDQHPAIGAALGTLAGDGAVRLRTLFTKTRESDWEEAAALGGWDALAPPQVP